MELLLKKIKRILSENRNIREGWHGSKVPFEGLFDENLIGGENDDGFSGRGFYFFPSLEDTRFAVPNGYARKFILSLKRLYNLDRNDIFSEDPPRGMSYSDYRNEETLELLKKGYDGAYRTMNNRIEEICVFSYKSKGFDGNNKIKPSGSWIEL